MKKVPRSSDLAITRIQSLCRRYTGRPAGQVMPMMAILFALLFSMSGLVLDGGTIYYKRRWMQAATDAAALGAAHELWLRRTATEAVAAGRDDAKLNGFEHFVVPDGFTPSGEFDPAITVTINIPPTTGSYTTSNLHAEVFIIKRYPTTFMRIAGVTNVQVRTRAVAGLVNYGEACVLALNPVMSGGITLSGTATVNSTCGVQANSHNPTALVSNGGGTLDALPEAVLVYGGYNPNGCGTCISPEPTLEVPPTPDWLAHVPEPTIPVGIDYTDLTINGGINHMESVVNPLGMVHYAAFQRIAGKRVPSLRIRGGQTRFYPGMHIFDSGLDATAGEMWTVGPSGTPGDPGEGSVFFNLNSVNLGPPVLNWNNIVIAGNVNTFLSPPTAGTYKGILFFEGRSAPEMPPGNQIVGTPASTFDGFLYFSGTHLVYSGNSSVNGWTGMIADSITFQGNVNIDGPPFDDISDETELRTVMLLE